MALIQFNQIQEVARTNSDSNISYFSLKQHGQEALVRFAYNNVSEFIINTVHPVEITLANNTKIRRNVNCLRTPKEDISVCPLCQADIKSRTIFYIPMIEYIIGENNTVSYRHVIWERSLSYAQKLKTLIDEYGPLQDCIFKVKRIGEAGNRETTYEILFANPAQYPEDVFVKDFSVFKDFSVSNRFLLNKSASEMISYLQTNSFPYNNENTNSTKPAVSTTQEQQVPVQPAYTPKAAVPESTPFTSASISNQTFVPATPSPSVQSTETTVKKPVRYY